MRWPRFIAAFLAGFVLGIFTLAYGAEKPLARAVDHYIEGQRYLQQGFLEAAEDELEEAVRLDPNYVDALSSLALVYLKRGKMTHYRAVLKRAAEVKAKQKTPPPRKKPPMLPPEPPSEPTWGPGAPPAPPPVLSPKEARLRKKPEPKDVFIVESRGKRDPLGNLRIDGRVKNNTSKTVRRVDVSLVAFNSNGKSIAPPTTYRGPWELQPGEKAPFSIDVSDRNNKVERFELKPSWEPVKE
jgi:tetratricopeptide (TPR) repeat protein